MSLPLCPVVLAILDAEPRTAEGVARELAQRHIMEAPPAHEAATITLRRLQRARLVYTAAGRPHATFRLTQRGRRELAFQRQVARRLARV